MGVFRQSNCVGTFKIPSRSVFVCYTPTPLRRWCLQQVMILRTVFFPQQLYLILLSIRWRRGSSNQYNLGGGGVGVGGGCLGVDCMSWMWILYHTTHTTRNKQPARRRRCSWERKVLFETPRQNVHKFRRDGLASIKRHTWLQPIALSHQPFIG